MMQKKRLRKKLAKKAIEKMRRNICIEYHLPYELLFPKKYMTITGFKAAKKKVDARKENGKEF